MKYYCWFLKSVTDMYIASNLCKIELENGISHLISTHNINWYDAFWDNSIIFQTCVSSEARLFLDSLNNVCQYDNLNSFQSKMLYIVLAFK